MAFYSGNTKIDDYFLTDTSSVDYLLYNQLWLWGINTDGQLGDNTQAVKSSPVQTITRGTNWKQVSLSVNHTAAIKTDGTLWLWGQNFTGQIGDNTNSIRRISPVQTISGGTNWYQAACGSGSSAAYTAAIKTDGTLWLWGQNNNGQLGDNTSGNRRSSPVQTIAGGTNWYQVACGFGHTAAVKTDGTLWTWGSNNNGQLGDNTTTNRSSPIQTIAGGTNWKQVVCGNAHTAAVKTDGTLWLWGQNNAGQLGDNTTTSRSSPVQIITGGFWTTLAVGTNSAAGIKTDGTLWLWGSNNAGQLGDNTTTSRSSPVQTITGGTNWKQVACGISNTAAVKTDGTLWTWGSNNNGQLGDNTTTNRSSPIQTIAGGSNWRQAAAYNHTAATINF